MPVSALDRYLEVLEVRQRQRTQARDAAARLVDGLRQQLDELERLQADYANQARDFAGQPLLLKRQQTLWHELQDARQAIDVQRHQAEAQLQKAQAALLTGYRERQAVDQLATRARLDAARTARRRDQRRSLERWLQTRSSNSEI